jgi:hypothetical protein
MIQLQFVCEDNIASQTIAWFSQGQFSHVDAVLPNGDLLGARSDSVGGQPPGVRIRPPGYVQFSRKAVMTLPCSDEQQKQFYAFLNDQLGKPYDSTAIWGFVVNRDWREDDSWICSELECAAGEKCKILPKLFVPASKVTPVCCAVAFSAVGGMTQLLV